MFTTQKLHYVLNIMLHREDETRCQKITSVSVFLNFKIELGLKGFLSLIRI